MNSKVNPQEPRRCPVCAGPRQRYDLQLDKCVCLFGHVYEPGAQQMTAQEKGAQA